MISVTPWATLAHASSFPNYLSASLSNFKLSVEINPGLLWLLHFAQCLAQKTRANFSPNQMQN